MFERRNIEKEKLLLKDLLNKKPLLKIIFQPTFVS